MNSRHSLRIGALVALTLCASQALPAQAWTTGSAAHWYSSHPMISGTVASVNDRQLVVNTDQGEAIALMMDSHTMAFRDLAAGMTVRVDFAAHENCRLYAERVWAVRGNAPAARTQGYATARHDADARKKPSAGNARASSAAAPAQDMNMNAPRATFAWESSIRPMIAGRVVSANDHLLIVDTEQGQRVGVTMDSHTLVPAEVGPGVAIRAQYRHLDDGRYLAQRVYAVPESAAEREQAYAWSRDRVVTLDPTTIDCSVATVLAREAAPKPAPVVTPPPAPAPPAPAPPAPTPAPPAPSKTERALVESGKIELEDVYFETGKATLLPASERTLNEAGAALEKHPELKVEVGGHTDSRGSRPMNVRLSQARAESVRAYLLEHFKIAPGNVTAKGYGPPANGVVEKSDAERQHNRRVELNVIK